LILVIIEGLSVLFKRAAEKDFFKGLNLSGSLCISLLKYADDTDIFYPASLEKLLIVKRLLR
jgi:hypothetical protein